MGTLHTSASKSSIRRFVITEKAPTRAFSWLKAAITAFTFKTLLGAFSVITNLRMELFQALVQMRRGQVSVWESITVLLATVPSVRRCLHVSDVGEVVGNVLCPNILFLCSTLDFCRSVIRVTSTPEGEHLDFSRHQQ